MRKLMKGRKRCPFCKLTEIYKRSRKEYHKMKNYDLKAYVCRNCKREFEVPFET